ncbi:MAG: hypothetical protein KF842_15305, partial [Caulobacter sp.]|nr:hypothetical protein [Caulobacter sp.]
LCIAAAQLAAEMQVTVTWYSRAEVREALGLGPKATRHQVARTVAEHISAFRHRLPNERRPWESVDRRLSLFSAAALALTHYAGVDNEIRYVFEVGS